MKARPTILPSGSKAIEIICETLPESEAFSRFLIEDPGFERVKRLLLGTAPSAESVEHGADHAAARGQVLPIRGSR